MNLSVKNSALYIDPCAQFFFQDLEKFSTAYVYGRHAAIRRARPRAASSTGTGRKNSCNRTASAAKSSVTGYIEAAASILYGGDSQDCL